MAPTAPRFAHYLRQKHKVYPRDLWQTQIVTLGSVPGINIRYRPALQAHYGPVAIREIYGATECMFGQQRDEKAPPSQTKSTPFFSLSSGFGCYRFCTVRFGHAGDRSPPTELLKR